MTSRPDAGPPSLGTSSFSTSPCPAAACQQSTRAQRQQPEARWLGSRHEFGVGGANVQLAGGHRGAEGVENQPGQRHGGTLLGNIDGIDLQVALRRNPAIDPGIRETDRVEILDVESGSVHYVWSSHSTRRKLSPALDCGRIDKGLRGKTIATDADKCTVVLSRLTLGGVGIHKGQVIDEIPRHIRIQRVATGRGDLVARQGDLNQRSASLGAGDGSRKRAGDGDEALGKAGFRLECVAFHGNWSGGIESSQVECVHRSKIGKPHHPTTPMGAQVVTAWMIILTQIAPQPEVVTWA